MELAGNIWDQKTWEPMNRQMEALGFKNTSKIDVHFYSTCPPIVISQQGYTHTVIRNLTVRMQPKLYNTSSDYLKVTVCYNPVISDIQFCYTRMKAIEDDKDFTGLIEHNLRGFGEIVDWFRNLRIEKCIPCSMKDIRQVQFKVPRYPKDGYADKTATVYIDGLSLTVDHVARKDYFSFNVHDCCENPEYMANFSITYVAKSKEAITPLDFYRNVIKIVRDKKSPVRTVMDLYKENIKLIDKQERT